MMTINSQLVRKVVTRFLARANPSYDISNLSDSTNFLDAGLIDSAKFLELVLLLEQAIGREIDFSEVDPEKMMSIGGICAYIDYEVLGINQSNTLD
jgi:acyl carrier protein